MQNKTILVTSTSQLKLDAVKRFFDSQNINAIISAFNCDGCNLPSQPIHCPLENNRINNNNNNMLSNVWLFAKERINYAQMKCPLFDSFDFIISIENGIDICTKPFLLDKCFVIIMSKGILADGCSGNNVVVPSNIFPILSTLPIVTYNNNNQISGYNVTAGELLHQIDNNINPKNWMISILGMDRIDQIVEGIKSAYDNFLSLLTKQQDIASRLKKYAHFPKKDVLFQDMFPLFADKHMLKSLIDFITYRYHFDNIDVVVGLESRGFLLGVPLALNLNAGFIPIRKEGKLPGKTFKAEYTKEYGVDTCEIQCDSFTIVKGQRALIIDDLIATGGSMQAAVELVKKCGGIVVDCCVLLNVPSLRETCNTNLDANYTVLIQ